MITLTIAREIGNEIEGGRLAYKCPEDIGISWGGGFFARSVW